MNELAKQISWFGLKRNILFHYLLITILILKGAMRDFAILW